jgi:alkylation response protein AidB-like acyl-CoA dehydrogenase
MSVPEGLSAEMCEMFVQTLHQVMTRDLPDDVMMELDENDTFPEDFIQKLLSPDVGLHLVFLPEEFGGLGGGARDICKVSVEMAENDLGVATSFLAICLGTDPILVGGNHDQKTKWLTKIATEGLIVAYGVTEPSAGSNVSSIQTTADHVLDADGNVTGYKLNGTKQFITNGGVAQLYTILAKTPGGISFFVVERDTAGLSVGKHEDKHGIRASNTTGVILEDVVVPVENLIGIEEGQGLKQANAVFGYTRLMVGAFGLGGGLAPLKRAIAYAKEREQFGGKLIEKQGYLFKLLVNNWVALEAGRAYMEQIALEIDNGDHDKGTEGSIAKLWCTEAGNKAAEDSIQALGGYGYAKEYMVEKMKRDVRITTIYEGTSEIQQLIIAMNRWKETVRSKGEYYNGLAAQMETLHEANPSLGAGMMGGAFRGLNDVIQMMHAARQTRQQPVMFAFADMMVHCEVAAAFVLEGARLAEAGSGECDSHDAMSRIMARKAVEQVRLGAEHCALGLLETNDETGLAAGETLLAGIDSRLPLAKRTGLWIDMEIVGNMIKEMD